MKSLCQNQKGAALPFVLLIVALNVTVIVAMLIYATTELQASKNAAQSEGARSLAQSGLDLAAGLIAANSTNNGFVSYQRVTNVGGDWRLETKIANVTAPDPAKPWKQPPPLPPSSTRDSPPEQIAWISTTPPTPMATPASSLHA